MSTYEEFMVILTIGLLIVAILNLHKKSKAALTLVEQAALFLFSSLNREAVPSLPVVLLSILYGFYC